LRLQPGQTVVAAAAAATPIVAGWRAAAKQTKQSACAAEGAPLAGLILSRLPLDLIELARS